MPPLKKIDRNNPRIDIATYNAMVDFIRNAGIIGERYNSGRYRKSRPYESIIAIKNTGSSIIPAYSFAEILSFKKNSGYYNVQLPSEDAIEGSRVVVVSEALSVGQYTIGYVRGVRKVRKFGDALETDKVGTLEDSGKAQKASDGSHIVLAYDDTYFWVKPCNQLEISWAIVIRGLKHADMEAAKHQDGILKYVMRIVDADTGAGTYNGSTTYAEGDKALYSTGNMDVDFLYRAKLETTGNAPPTTTVGAGDTLVYYPDSDANWESLDIIPKGIASATGNYFDSRSVEEELRKFVRWFEIDDIVTLIKRDNNWHIMQTLFPVGDVGEASITWIEAENRVAAVYK